MESLLFALFQASLEQSKSKEHSVQYCDKNTSKSLNVIDKIKLEQSTDLEAENQIQLCELISFHWYQACNQWS